MSKEESQISNPTTEAPYRQTNKVKYLIYGLLSIIILAAIILIYTQNKDSKISNLVTGPNRQTYSRMDNYKLRGAKSGAGATFSKPIEYRLASESSNKDSASFSHTLSAPVYAPLGSVHIASVGLPQPIDDQYVKNLTLNLSSPQGEGYKIIQSSINDFFAIRFSPLYDIKYASAKKITSANLKSAWVLNFSAEPKTNAPSITPNESTSSTVESNSAKPIPSGPLPPGFEKYKGQVVFALGKQTHYYFAIYNTDYNWDNNQNIWQQVIDSLKIDQ